MKKSKVRNISAKRASSNKEFSNNHTQMNLVYRSGFFYYQTVVFVSKYIIKIFRVKSNV